MKKCLSFLLCLACAFAVYLLTPESMPELARRCAALFVFAGLLWAFEVFALHAVSLALVVLQILLLAEEGGFAPEGGIAYQEFLKPFASPVIMLFLGGFLLSRAMTKHGVARILFSKILKPFASSASLFLWSLIAITAFFSLWISNTATTAMMLAILIPALKKMPRDRFHSALILAVPFGATIGGMGTPIGTPPNAIAVAALREMGLTLTFTGWMMAAVPLMLILLGLVWIVLKLLFPVENKFQIQLAETDEALSREGKWTSAITLAAVFLWLTRPWHGLDESVPALMAAAGLTALKLLDRKDIDSIEWDILVLMWGGLSLSTGMSLTGLADWFGALNWAQLPPSGRAAMIAGMTVALSTFMNNTASASLLIPLAIAAGGAAHSIHAAFLTALAASLALALPISTAPNAMAFASGRLRAADMLKAGSLISILGLLIILTAQPLLSALRLI